MRSRHFIYVIIVIPFVYSVLTFAQVGNSAALYGTVADASGAVMANVKITVTNVGTNEIWSLVSNSNGAYEAPNLPPGEYRVNATARGMSAFEVKGVFLEVGRNVRVLLSMRVTAVAETVSVTAGASLVDTQSPGVSGTVDRQFIDALPLIDRDASALLYIQSGTEPGDYGAVSMNGTRGGHNDYQIDGVSAQDPAFTQFQTNPSFPSPDSIQEFTLLKNGYSAQYGNNESGQILIETRSGTNSFHGSAFDYLRNQVLDDKSYFATDKTPYRRNIFGGTLGGPIHKNKLFFFTSYQGIRTFSSPNVGVTAIVPTAAQRAGDFSASAIPIIDPTTGLPFLGNQIPSNRLDPVSQNILSALVPLPNGQNGEFILAVPSTVHANQLVAKVDYDLSQKDRLTGSYMLNNTNNNGSVGLPLLFSLSKEHDQIASLTETHLFSSTLVNAFTIGGTRYYFAQVPIAPDNATVVTYGAKMFVPSGPQQLSVDVGSDLNIDDGAETIWSRSLINIKDSISWVTGNHSFRFGGEARLGKFRDADNFWGGGHFNFDGSITGDPFADFMLGRPMVFDQFSPSSESSFGQDYSLYAQDTWRVTRNLTLNPGLRYVPTFFQKNLNGENSNFFAGEQSVIFPNAPRGLVYQGDPGVDAYYHDPVWDVLEPRIGLAWAPFGNAQWAVRASFGIFHQPPMIFSADNNLPQPFALEEQISGPPTFGNPYNGGPDPFPFQPVIPSSSASQRDAVQFQTGTNLGDYMAKNVAVPVTEQWNLTLQHQLSSNDGIEASYAGAHSYHTLYQLIENVPIYIPGGSTETNENSRRPDPNFAGIYTNTRIGYGNYNSLQLNYRHQASHGFTVLANYTWSKALTLGEDADQAYFQSPYNPFNVRSSYGPADYDITHRANVSYVWNLPWLNHSSGALPYIASGWTLSGIASFLSGAPFTVYSGVDNSLTGIGEDHALQLGNPSLPGGSSRSHQIQEWFNTSAFTVNPVGTFGDSGRNSLRGPGGRYWDMALFKTFPVTEAFRIQFRADAENIFNHTVLSGVQNYVTSAAFGQITGTANPRIIQLALRFLF